LVFFSLLLLTASFLSVINRRRCILDWVVATKGLWPAKDWAGPIEEKALAQGDPGGDPGGSLPVPP
jgi:hypothetical protein